MKLQELMNVNPMNLPVKYGERKGKVTGYTIDTWGVYDLAIAWENYPKEEWGTLIAPINNHSAQAASATSVTYAVGGGTDLMRDILPHIEIDYKTYYADAPNVQAIFCEIAQEDGDWCEDDLDQIEAYITRLRGAVENMPDLLHWLDVHIEALKELEDLTAPEAPQENAYLHNFIRSVQRGQFLKGESK